jgi:DNA-directed RNA polymerase specialized sigma24 family protein
MATTATTERPPGSDDLRHGYTLTDLHQLARLAVHTAGAMAGDWHDRYDTAWSAIVEHLYTTVTPPARYDLVRAGQLGIYAVVDGDRQHHGYYRRKSDGAQHGPCSSPAFQTYWVDWITSTVSDPAQGIVERLALPAVLATLTDRQRQALLALAAHDSYPAAAAALGVRQGTFSCYIADARRRIDVVWHQGETPVSRWVDRRVASHSTAPTTRSTLAERMSARRTRRRRATKDR